MLKHTTTFGVRKTIASRYMLKREIKTVKTPFGEVRIKDGEGYGVTKSKREYEDVATMAKEHGYSFKEMERRIWESLNHPENK